MRPSFAQFHLRLLAGLLVSVVAGCASLPPPTAELSAAQQALARASDADADQYAAEAIALARDELGRAQAAAASGDDDDARNLAQAAAADADLAYARSRAAANEAEYRQHRDEVVALRQRLQMPPGDETDAVAGLPAPVDAGAAPTDPAVLSGRLVALDADPRLNNFAAYERLRARQAIDGATALRGGKREIAAGLAARRVTIAELAARSEAIRRATDQLDRERSDLLVEASRQEAERARAEAERLRIEAQVQAEEAERLRAAADAETAARQQAEEVIQDVGGKEAARLKAAKAREAELAAQEAALMAGQEPAPDKAKDASESKKKPSKTKP